MSNPRRLAELAGVIRLGSLEIDSYLAANGRASPSNDVKDTLALSLPEELAQTRVNVIEAIDELHCLLQGPVASFTTSIVSHLQLWAGPQVLRSISFQPTLQIALHALHRFDFAGAFPVGSTASYAEIASHTGLREEDVRRLLRVAMTHRIFRETAEGYVEHTALSRAVAETPLLRQYLGHMTEEIWRASTRIVDATQRWPDSYEPSETGYNIASSLPGVAYFDGLKNDPYRARRFEDTMRFTHQAGGYDRAVLLHMHEWSKYRLVVDVGGGAGQMCVDLARRFSQLHAINQDLEDVIAAADAIPKDLDGRVRMQVHNFLEPQPIKNADAYVFRWIFHDWADAYAVRILRAIIPAMKKGAKIVIGDVCLPKPGTIPLTVERGLR